MIDKSLPLLIIILYSSGMFFFTKATIFCDGSLQKIKCMIKDIVFIYFPKDDPSPSNFCIFCDHFLTADMLFKKHFVNSLIDSLKKLELILKQQFTKFFDENHLTIASYNIVSYHCIIQLHREIAS